MEPAEFLVPFEVLLEELEGLAGGRTALLVHAGSVLLVWFVVGRLISKNILRSDAGAIRSLLAGILPWVIGGSVWGLVAAFKNSPLFDAGPVAVDLALLCGGVAGLLGGLFGVGKLLSRGYFIALCFLLFMAGAGAGALVVSSASLKVFETGARTVEERKERAATEN